ncbi:MAG: stage III sporulation protein AE [Firmicutes bacterium]|nr:stage III sporulation protein AE [Bacillota bacterium]
MKETLKKQLENIIDTEKTTDLSEYASHLTGGISDYFTLDEILHATLEGKSIFDQPQLIESLKDLLLLEVRSAMVISVEILGICIIAGLLKNMSGSFASKGVSDIASFVCMISIVGVTILHFNQVYDMTLDAMKTMTYTMEILLPVMIGILIAMGQVTTGTIMSPLLLTVVTAFHHIIKNIILPAVFFSAVFTLLNCITEKDYVNQLAKIIRKAALYGTGLLVTLMTGIINIQGLITKTSDGLIINTAKYSIDAFIPIVGGFTADTVELFLTCMRSIKNIVGLFGIFLILTLILVPVLKLLVIAAIYKLTACLTEPVAGRKTAEGISDIGSVLITLTAILFFSSLLFILFITSIMKLGGSL